MQEDERVSLERVVLRGYTVQRLKYGGDPVDVRCQSRPLSIKPLAQQRAFLGTFRRLYQAQWIAWRDPETLCAERKCPEYRLLRRSIRVARLAQLRLLFEPGCALSR